MNTNPCYFPKHSHVFQSIISNRSTVRNFMREISLCIPVELHEYEYRSNIFLLILGRSAEWPAWGLLLQYISDLGYFATQRFTYLLGRWRIMWIPSFEFTLKDRWAEVFGLCDLVSRIDMLFLRIVCRVCSWYLKKVEYAESWITRIDNTTSIYQRYICVSGTARQIFPRVRQNGTCIF